MEFKIPDESLENWLSQLKTYQKNSITELLKSNDELKTAEIWVTSTGPKNIVTFGGEPKQKPFWNNLKMEFDQFLCNDSVYIKEKNSLKEESPISQALIVSTISGALGAKLGLAATLLAPAIVLLLYCASKITLKAYCNTYYKTVKE
jgi:hypothetical protein